MKCSWCEAISFSKENVLQTRRDIQREILGKGPYSLSVSYMHLTVTDNQWTGMDHKEKEKHLQKLGTSSGECLQQEINERKPASERMGSFESSGFWFWLFNSLLISSTIEAIPQYSNFSKSMC